MRNVNLMKAMVSGVLLVIAAAVVALLIAFIFEANLDIPGVAQVNSASGGRPSTELAVNPFAVILLGALVGLVMWAAGKMRDRQRD
jgi:chromate transport protein ChrA